MPYDDAVFLCAANPHLMTAIKAGGYGVIYLTPAALADWTDGETVIKVDVSTLRNSGRDWWDVWLTPYDDLMAAPLDGWLPDLQGPPKRGLHLKMDGFNGGTSFRGERVDDHATADLGSCWWCTYESVLTPSASRRDTFELRISQTGVRWAVLNGATGQPLITWVQHTWATPLGWTQGVVQFGHHSYTPDKDCANPGTVGCRAGTWHWDNLSISRTSPMTIIPAQQRRANATQPTYTFSVPAPADARIMVNALAETLDLSLDGGATWQAVTQQSNVRQDGGHMRAFWHPIPAGTTSVMLRGSNAWVGPWDANHAAIYSQQPRSNPPTPTVLPPTNTPMPTETPVPTFTPGPTSTPQPIPTATLTSPPATSTSVPPTATQPAATATTGPQGNCSVTVSPNRKTGSWSCP
jgi:hypothetical protein